VTARAYTATSFIPRILELRPKDAALNNVRFNAKQIGCLLGSIQPEYQKNFRAILDPHLVKKPRNEHRLAPSQEMFFGEIVGLQTPPSTGKWR
jgi:hypothetical protein